MDAVMQAVGGLLLKAMIARKAEIQPNASVSINSTVAIITFTKRDIGSRFHAAVAVSGAGDIAGAIQNKKGDALCAFGGVYDTFTDCLALVGCREFLSDCF